MMRYREWREQNTKANRLRRIQKDQAKKARAQRKKAQRRNKQELALLASPNKHPQFVSSHTLVSLVRKHFGGIDTVERVRAWLEDRDNMLTYQQLPPGVRLHNAIPYTAMRKPFVLSDGRMLSIQQSATHYCDENSVELWHCPEHELLAPYGNFDEAGYLNGPYARVPIEVVAVYIDALETQ